MRLLIASIILDYVDKLKCCVGDLAGLDIPNARCVIFCSRDDASAVGCPADVVNDGLRFDIVETQFVHDCVG